MNDNSVIIIEAMFVGIITVIIGHLSRYLLNLYYNVEEKVSIYESWNKNYIMEKQLYVTGLLINVGNKTSPVEPEINDGFSE